MSARDPALRLLLDRAELHDLMDRYAVAVDRRDFDAVAECFAPDLGGRWELEARDGLIAYIRGVARFDSTMHMMGTQLIEVRGDQAQIDSLAMLRHRATRRDGSEFRYDPSGSRYCERAERRDGRWLLDRPAIADLLTSYALGIDLRDWDRVRACLAPGFRADFGPRRVEGADELVDYLRGVERFASTTHFLGTPLVALAGDEALAEAPVVITHREQDEDAPEWATRRRYRDRLVRHEGRWRLAERGLRLPEVEAAPVPASEAPDVSLLLDRAAIRDVITLRALADDRAADHPTQRLLGNQLVALEPDRAEVESYAYVSRRPDREGEWTHWSDGATRYLDTLVREGGHWRIAERRVEGAYTHVPVR